MTVVVASIAREGSLFIARIASTSPGPTVINLKPFNMQIPAPPTARGLLSVGFFFIANEFQSPM